jgi:sulfur relay (sulfurtransferase) DsrC/TusE family protein
MKLPMKSWVLFVVDKVFYFEIVILLRRSVQIAETWKILSYLRKIYSYFVVNPHLNIYVHVSVFCMLYEFRT